jgi:hypothetical protein
MDGESRIYRPDWAELPGWLAHRDDSMTHALDPLSWL